MLILACIITFFSGYSLGVWLSNRVIQQQEAEIAAMNQTWAPKDHGSRASMYRNIDDDRPVE